MNLCCIFTSRILNVQLLIEIWIHPAAAEACILVMLCLGYACVWLKALLSLLKEARNSFFGLGVYLLKSKFRIQDKLRFP